jgi:hypothetical protein
MGPRFPDGCGGKEIGAIAYPQGASNLACRRRLVVTLFDIASKRVA